MRPLPLLALAALGIGFLYGCGDPAPSTTLAPDKPLPDASKLSPDQVDKMLKTDHDAGRR